MKPEEFEKMGLKKNPDGTFSKPKTVPQPRERLKQAMSDYLHEDKNKFMDLINEKEEYPDIVIAAGVAFFSRPTFRKISLTLFGIPMAKQSVRATKTGHFFQPKTATDRTKDYQKQIREQLPKDFVMFSTVVFVRKMHFVYPPLKAFHTKKGTMDAIREGKKFYKNTRPDLPDNLKKLVNDSMSGIVFSDDGIIVGEDNIRKYYGIGGCIIIELEGY